MSEPFRETIPAHTSLQTGCVEFRSPRRVRRYLNPIEIIETTRLDEVAQCLRQMEAAVDRGLHAAGFVSYEAAPAFDSALAACPPNGFPLVWFGIYSEVEESPPALNYENSAKLGPWRHAISEAEYTDIHRKIREYIAAGDVYQINYAFPMQISSLVETPHLFEDLCNAQRTHYGALIDTGAHRIVSISPELFFLLDGDRIVTAPMKGTAPRGLGYADDRKQADTLLSSEKERAENLMIVDLLRNDLGRIAQTGTVKVESLFEVERYPTLWQMTSKISATTHATASEIFGALFPSGSITGAPKIRAMEIINELEGESRGVYCGAIGWWGPERQAEFNVAIRTLTIDAESHTATYPVGSGITWDSNPKSEFAECKLKASVLSHAQPRFELLESILWDGAKFFLLDLHLRRLSRSAEYFCIDYDEKALLAALEVEAASLDSSEAKVRLLLTESGIVCIESEPVKSSDPVTICFAENAVDDSDVFLYHKTTNRTVYVRALAGNEAYDDVLLWNRRGEITESTAANLVVELEGRMITPNVSCGLLAGTMRERLLATGEIEEGVLRREDVEGASRIYLINSVRKWRDATLR